MKNKPILHKWQSETTVACGRAVIKSMLVAVNVTRHDLLHFRFCATCFVRRLQLESCGRRAVDN